MKRPLLRWFLIWILAMGVGVVLFGIFGPTAKQIDMQEISYTTTESSILYFKNMRAYFYDKEEDQQSGYTLYRIDSRAEEGKSNLHFIIVHNWRLNEAYLMAESDLVDLDHQRIAVVTKSKKLDTVKLKGFDAEAHYRFAAGLFEAIENKEELSIFRANKEVLLSQAEIKSLKKSLSDYFKLVGKLR